MASAAVNVAARTAFMSIASRVVGATFRIGESYQPSVQAKGVTMDPDIIIKREVVGLVSSWVLSFVASLGAMPLVARYKWNQNIAMFGIAVFGAAAAEAISRWVAYRDIKEKDEADDDDAEGLVQTPSFPPHTQPPQVAAVAPPLHRIYPLGVPPTHHEPARPAFAGQRLAIHA